MTAKRLVDVPRPTLWKIAAMVFSFILPTIILIPMLSEHFSAVHDLESIRHRETWFLAVSMVILALLIRKLEEESFGRLLSLALIWSVYISVIVSLAPPF